MREYIKYFRENEDNINCYHEDAVLAKMQLVTSLSMLEDLQ
jgi:hypothetical protein